MSNEHAECLREAATDIEAIDSVEMAIVGVTMRNAADEIERLSSRLDRCVCGAGDKRQHAKGCALPWFHQGECSDVEPMVTMPDAFAVIENP